MNECIATIVVSLVDLGIALCLFSIQGGLLVVYPQLSIQMFVPVYSVHN